MNKRLFLGIALIAIPLIMPTAVSASLIWDANLTTGGAQDGAGTWDDGATSNWWDTGGAPPADVPWNSANKNIAQIGTGTALGANATIAINGTVTAGGLIMKNTSSSKNYTIAGGTLVFATSDSSTPKIDFQINPSWSQPVISANIQGPTVEGVVARTNLDVDGEGTGSVLTLSGTNKLGAVHVMSSVANPAAAMCVYFGSTAALDATSLAVDPSCEVRLQGAGTYNVPITLNSMGNGVTAPNKNTTGLYNTVSGVILGGNITLTGNSSLGGSTGAMTVNGVISDGDPSAHYSLTKSGASSTVVLANSNMYTGDTQIYRGTLELNSTSGPAINKNGGNVVFMNGNTTEALTLDLDEQIGDSAIVDFQNNVTAVFNLNGHTETVAGLTRSAGTSVPTIRNNAASTDAKLILSPASGAAYTFSGILANGSTAKLALQKDGLGSQTLSGACTYTGDTVVNAGSLAIDGSITSAVDVKGGSLKGHGTITGAVVAESGGSIEPGNSIGTLTITGNVALGGTLDVEYDGAAAGQKIDLLAVTGDLDLTGATFAFAPATGGSPLSGEPHVFVTYTGGLTGTAGGTAPAGYQVDYGTPGQIALIIIPEPSTWILLVLGGMALAAYKRRRG
jgi:autotransporter-associated beta strand protein